MGNLGDEAILAAFLRETSRYRDVEVTVISRDPSAVSAYHGVPSINSRDWLSRGRVRRALKRSDMFLLGGGGLLKDYGDTPDSLIGWVRYLRTAQEMGVTNGTYAIGAENIRFKASRKALTEVLGSADLVTVRDELSADVLRSAGVHGDIEVTSDPAVLLPGRSRWRDTGETERRVAICVRHWFSKGNVIEDPAMNEALLDAVAGTADHIVDRGMRIDLIPMRTGTPDDDRVVAKQVLDRMSAPKGARIVQRTPTVDTFLDGLPRYTLMIGMRLHALILAASVGLPVVGIEYMPKVAGFMESIGEGESSLAIHDITAQSLTDAVDGVLEDPTARSEAMSRKVDGLRTLARRNVEMVMDLAGAEPMEGP
jgi:polysaccharide pyruvyl transferase CsaB